MPLCTAIIAAMALSCTQEAEAPESLNGGNEVEFTASWAEDDESRTVLQENETDIWWSTKEDINVFFGAESSGKFTSTNTEPQEVATFRGTLNTIIGSIESYDAAPAYWAIYPYDESNTCDGQSVTLKVPDEQSGVAGTFADHFFPAVATGESFRLAFYNVCGGARFSVVTEGVQKVVFRSNDGSPMAGTVKVAFGEDNHPEILEVSDARDSVVVFAPEGGFVPGDHYFAAMLPQTHEQGMTVRLYMTTKKTARTIDKSVTVGRSVFGKLDNVDEGLEYTDITPYEMVDLGLSVKWATCNVGASSPEEYGDYFAWGETEPKEDCSWDTYKWCKGASSTITKYCDNPNYGYSGFTDNKTGLDPEDDAATVIWGGKWRMPTRAEQDELINNCSWTWTNINGVYGRKVTSKKSGFTDKWIFLPAAGIRYGTSLNSANSYGCYLSSSLSNTDKAAYVYFTSTDIYWYNFSYRCYGRSIRPVYGDIIHVTGISVSPDKTTVNFGRTLKLSATITPSNAHEKGVKWSSSDESVATVNTQGLVSGIAAGTAIITATSIDGGLVTECTVTVKVPVPKAVDLGLSVKWASFNLGATAPEEYGYYYAWGETSTKTDYSWSTYKWCNGSSSTITKYCTNSNYGYNGFTDGKTILEPDDDVASVLLDDRWHIPTYDEFEELKTQCTWEWKTINGVYGRMVTSNKEGYTDKWIFLPAAGYQSGASIYNTKSQGRYWSSTLGSGSLGRAYYVDFTSSGNAAWGYIYRYDGLSIRPVYISGDYIHVTGITVSPENATLHSGGTLQLSATITPSNAQEKGVKWSSSDESVATVNTDGLVSGIAVGSTVITASSMDGDFTAECIITVKALPELTELGKTFVAVDLGLNVKWASFNLGSSAPEEYGSYFAWGETSTKSDYSWTTYKWCNGSSSTMTKYCTNSNYGDNGFTDGKTILEPDDDAASVLLGGSWHTPTYDEFEELKTQCTWEWKTINGVYGRMVTSNKEGYMDKWIFLPAAGYRDGTSLHDAGSLGYYWSSSLYTDYPSCAHNLFLYSDYVGWNYHYARFYGLSIRPVL